MGVRGHLRGAWEGYLQGVGTDTLGPEVWKLQETRDTPLSR